MPADVKHNGFHENGTWTQPTNRAYPASDGLAEGNPMYIPDTWILLAAALASLPFSGLVVLVHDRLFRMIRRAYRFARGNRKRSRL